MNQGRIVQIGTPHDIYERPRDKFVADFVGTTNFIEATGVECAGSRCGYGWRILEGVNDPACRHLRA